MSTVKANLTALPPEIIDCVAQNLQLPELRRLRLTSKALANNSSFRFGYTYVNTVTTNLSLSSIQKLEGISESTWAKHVKILRLEWDEEDGHGFTWRREQEYPKAIIPDLPVIQQVRDIILRFIDCRSFCITAPHEQDHWCRSRLDKIGCSDLLGLSFILIAETGLALETFRVRFGSDNGQDRVKRGWVHTEQIKRAMFKKTFSQIKELSLECIFDDDLCDWAWQLVSEAVQVQKLIWRPSIYGPVYFEPIGLSNVRELSFGFMEISKANLTALLQRCRHCLRALTFYMTKLDQSWRGIFRYLQDFEDLESISFHFLRLGPEFDSCVFPSLDDSVALSGESDQKLHLRRMGLREPRRVAGVDYSGPSVRRVLEMLENAIAIED